MPTQSVVFALTMRDRYFASLWQRYLERTFVYTHQPRPEGKQIVFLVAGPLSSVKSTHPTRSTRFPLTPIPCTSWFVRYGDFVSARHASTVRHE
jgi:hypothetical protein